MRVFRVVLPLLLLLATFSMAEGQSSIQQAKIDTGIVQGAPEQRITAFKGIPFAAPPVGNLRWRPPQPVARWKGARPATQYGSDCAQLPFPSDAAPLGTSTSEDCLYVNVWTPARKSDEKLPVLIWIYGGGFVNGGSSPRVYAGDQFAEGGVVFVSFNYRVGRFGFFAFPALSKEGAGGPQGNYAYMDQIEALRWVQKNIHAFGGDPTNVTIFGESAGGGSVIALLTSPLTKGLFERAIVESGGGRDSLLGARYLDKQSPAGLPSLEDIGVAFAKSVGIEGTDDAALAALRALPTEKVVAGLNMASMGQQSNTYGGPIIDGKIVIEAPQAALLSGHYWKMPVMIGANSADIGFPRWKTLDETWAAFGPDASEAAAIYDPDKSGNTMMVGWKIGADMMMIEPARFVARTISAAGQPLYEYRFSYVADSIRNKVPGALHATEIPFVFDTVAAKYGRDLTTADQTAAKQANEYWINFAKTGDPNGAGLPHWPAYSGANDELLNFTDEGPAAQADQWKARLDLIEKLAAKPAESRKVISHEIKSETK